jgi:Leucine-rich repeat (LRR) protein
LVELDLQNNDLTEFKLKSEILKRLHLGRNSIRIFPIYKKQLPILEELYLDGNKIEFVPDILSIMPLLKILDMRYNSIRNPINTIQIFK